MQLHFDPDQFLVEASTRQISIIRRYGNDRGVDTGADGYNDFNDGSNEGDGARAKTSMSGATGHEPANKVDDDKDGHHFDYIELLQQLSSSTMRLWAWQWGDSDSSSSGDSNSGSIHSDFINDTNTNSVRVAIRGSSKPRHDDRKGGGTKKWKGQKETCLKVSYLNPFSASLRRFAPPPQLPYHPTDERIYFRGSEKVDPVWPTRGES